MTENGLVTWPRLSTLLFYTLNLTENYNCKSYYEFEYDQKWLFISESTVNIYWPCFHNLQYCKHTLTFDSTVNICLQYRLLWKQGQYMFTVLSKVNTCLQFIFGHTHTRRNVYSCNFRSNFVSKNGNVYSLLDSVILIRSSWLASKKLQKFFVWNKSIALNIFEKKCCYTRDCV